ncbi:hypothetical protein LINPERHAP1_LOCUS7402 [Linum perenne]
MIMSSSPPRL